jgi:hypothetical protein
MRMASLLQLTLSYELDGAILMPIDVCRCGFVAARGRKRIASRGPVFMVLIFHTKIRKTKKRRRAR